MGRVGCWGSPGWCLAVSRNSTDAPCVTVSPSGLSPSFSCGGIGGGAPLLSFGSMRVLQRLCKRTSSVLFVVSLQHTAVTSRFGASDVADAAAISVFVFSNTLLLVFVYLFVVFECFSSVVLFEYEVAWGWGVTVGMFSGWYGCIEPHFLAHFLNSKTPL